MPAEYVIRHDRCTLVPPLYWSELKKKEGVLESVHTARLRTLNPEKGAVDIAHAGEAEMDEMWSLSGIKTTHAGAACDRAPHGQGLGLCLWAASGYGIFAAENPARTSLGSHNIIPIIGVPTRVTSVSEEHTPGKRNTQKIERKHLTLRTRMKRLVRQTICFSKSIQMHDLVIGLFVNRYAFGRAV